MSDREWLPSQYMDEVVPPLRSSPSDWIVRLPGDAYALAPGWDDDEDTATEGCILKNGARTAFSWCQRHGGSTFTLNADGTWEVDREPPSETNHIWAPLDHSSMHRSLLEFAAWMVKTEEPGEFQIQYSTWSEAEVFFRFNGDNFVEIRPCGCNEGGTCFWPDCQGAGSGLGHHP